MLFRILLLEIRGSSERKLSRKIANMLAFFAKFRINLFREKNAKFSQNKKCETYRNRLTQKFILEKKDPTLAALFSAIGSKSWQYHEVHTLMQTFIRIFPSTPFKLKLVQVLDTSS